MRVVVLGQLPLVVTPVELNLPKYTFPAVPDGTHCVDGVVLGDGYRGVADALGPGLLGTVHVEQLVPAVLHTHPVG